MACLLLLSLLVGRVTLRVCVFSLYHACWVRAYGFVRSYGAFACFVGAIGWCAHLVSCLTVGSMGAHLSCDRVIGGVVDCGRFSCRCSGKGCWPRGAV